MLSSRILRDQLPGVSTPGPSKGVGFVRLQTREQASVPFQTEKERLLLTDLTNLPQSIHY